MMVSSSSLLSKIHHSQKSQGNERNDGEILRQTPPTSQVIQSSSTTPFYTPIPPSPARLTPMRASDAQLHYRTPIQQHRTLLVPSQQLLLSQERKSNDTAAAFARTSPQAGFLYKLSSNKAEFQRRFFVLKPSTHLYYFVSPHDTEPRGCIDLEGSRIELLETLPDGSMRFAIRLAEQEKTIVLEARTNGQAWMDSLQTERLSFCQQELLDSKQRNVGYKHRISDLEKQVRNFELVEKDRDGALEDAASWKNRHEKLNEALRLLTQYIRINNEDGGHVGENLDFAALEESTVETNFSTLHNACHQLKESVRLLAIEASTAVEDLQTALKAKEAVEKRMLKAEKHICTLWNENTTLRHEIKVIRKEKRMLVKEVKTLRAQTAKVGFLQDRPVDEVLEKKLSSQKSLLDQEGERLMEDLESQIETTIRLQEAVLETNHGRVSTSKQTKKIPEELDRSDSAETTKVINSVHGAELEDDEFRNDSRSSPIEPKVLSLMDNDSSDDGDPDDDDDDDNENDRTNDMASSVSSGSAQVIERTGLSLTSLKEMPPAYDFGSDIDSVVTERCHPLTTLDENDVDNDNDGDTKVSKSIFTDNGRATSRLDGSLPSEVERNGTTMGKVQKVNGMVYHLTFYSRKLGLQFQKVPPSVANGLLNKAFTAELDGTINSSSTEAELRRIADVTKLAGGQGLVDDGVACKVASPVDAVLVCGFIGFDDTANHARPNLGARLVAIDGISVEFGKWTFNSIRRAIQTRGRPLTLSFRNDYLTTQQKAILTRAISEVEASMLPLKVAVKYQLGKHPTGSTSTSPMGHPRELLHDSKPSWNARNYHDDEESMSTRSSNSNRHQTFSAVSSIATSAQDFRSFSDTGTSSVFASTLGPIMGKLLSGVSKADGIGKPSFMSRKGESLEDLPSHHDFQNSLL